MDWQPIIWICLLAATTILEIKNKDVEILWVILVLWLIFGDIFHV